MAQLAALRRAPGLKSFSQLFPKRQNIHQLLGQQRLEPGILNIKRLRLPGVRHLDAAIPGTPFVERRTAEAVPAAQLLRANLCLMRLQYPNDLFFRDP